MNPRVHGIPILWSIGRIRNLVDVQVAGIGGQHAASLINVGEDGAM